jgi:hypothetical protein
VTDSELRALVREAVARHFAGPSPESAVPGGAGFPSTALGAGSPPLSRPAACSEHRRGEAGPSWFQDHASHGMYLLVNVGDACLIEPAVTCNHCGYCKSHGH